MKRNTVARVALCLILMATVGTGAVNAKHDENPSQAGKSSIYFYDVAATDTHGEGKLVIDLKHHTFVFIGQDFQPSAQIALRARESDSTDYAIFAKGKATPSGNLHISGTWEPGEAAAEVVAGTYYEIINGFNLHNGGWFIAKLACYYSTDGGVTWTESGHTEGITMGHGTFLEFSYGDMPEGALLKIHVIVVGGKDRTGSEVFQYTYYAIGPAENRYACYDITGVTWNPKLTFTNIVNIDW